MFLSYAWHNNHCFPGQERLASDMGMSVSRTNEFIKELEAANLIAITRRGQGKTNLYTIKFTVKRKPKTSFRPAEIKISAWAGLDFGRPKSLIRRICI